MNWEKATELAHTLGNDDRLKWWTFHPAAMELSKYAKIVAESKIEVATMTFYEDDADAIVKQLHGPRLVNDEVQAAQRLREMFDCAMRCISNLESENQHLLRRVEELERLAGVEAPF